MFLLPRSVTAITIFIATTGFEPLAIADSSETSDVRPFVQDSIASIIRATYEDDIEAAESLRNDLFAQPLTDEEAALVYQMEGRIHAEQGELPKAISALEDGLDLDAVSQETAQALQYDLAQLLFETSRPDEGLVAMLTWYQRIETPSSDEFGQVADAFVRAERYEEALQWVDRGIRMGLEPGVEWIVGRMGLLVLMNRYEDLREQLEQVAAELPEIAEEIISWVSYRSEHEDDENPLAVMEWADSEGLLDGDQKVQFAKLYLRLGMPYKAAVVMERGLYDRVIDPEAEHWQLLAESWLAVPDLGRAAEPLQNAAEMSGNADLYQRLGRLHLDLRRWEAAAAALRKALEGGARGARLWLFAALFVEARLDEAREVLFPPPAKTPSDPGTRPSETEAITVDNEGSLTPSTSAM